MSQSGSSMQAPHIDKRCQKPQFSPKSGFISNKGFKIQGDVSTFEDEEEIKMTDDNRQKPCGDSAIISKGKSR